MNIVDVNIDNIDNEHICCAISENDKRVISKKSWMKERFNDGLVFKKLNERAKVFIEYIPIEKSFAPIDGKDYMYINCLWVSGKYKGQGYSNELLNICIKDAKNKGKRGLVGLAGNKKKPFLSDGDYFKYKGFKIADKLNPYYELLYLNFDENDSNKPGFNIIEDERINENDIVIYYSNQCPHTEMYIDLIEKIADEKNVDLKIIKINTIEEAKKCPNPFTTYSIYIKGKFVTNEILSEKKFLKILKEENLGD